MRLSLSASNWACGGSALFEFTQFAPCFRRFELAAAAAFTLRFLSSVGGIYTIAGAFHGRFELLGRRLMLIVLHSGFAGRERHCYVTNSGNRLQRLRYIADTAAASHAGYFQSFSLQDDSSFYWVE